MNKVSILGAGGRMGGALIRAVLEHEDFALAGALARHGSADLGKDAGVLAGMPATGVTVSDNLAEVLGTADVAIDFTLPDATVFNVNGCETAGCALVIGSTGHSDAQLKQLRDRPWRIPAVLAPNMSAGVSVLYRLAHIAAQALPDFDAEICEVHHRGKKDAPSGTALQLGDVVASARGRAFAKVARLGRGPDDGARNPGEIGVSALRAGEVVGEHSLLLAGRGERLEIRHSAQDRGSFAAGALKAAGWARGRDPGLYDMGDVLGLSFGST